MASNDYEAVEVPGVGELRARKGTSTLELAGAVKFWHDKYKSARLDGFIAGASMVSLLGLLSAAAYFLIH